MSATSSQPARTVDELVKDAYEHWIFPLAPVADIKERGPSIFVGGNGVEVIDANGKTFLDMMSTHTRANSLGYGNEEVAKAVYEQLRSLHYVGTVGNISEPALQLAKKIADLAPGRLSKVHFTSGGSESVEAAIKLAKQYQIASGKKPRAHKIISRWNAYHGATMGALAATDWLGTRHISEPGVPGYSLIPGPSHYRNPFGMDDAEYEDFCATYLERQIEHEGPEYVAAFIGEPVMQAHGVQEPSPRYWQRVREICDKYDVLLICDEVITGFGRTGDWFAIERHGIEPDIMTMAKALTAGYMPMGAVITRAEIADALPVFRHVHTFSGHAGAAAAANAVIAIKERDRLVPRAKELGEYFQRELKAAVGDHVIVGDVRGVGMWHAVDFTADHVTKAPFDDDTVAAVVRRMQDYGVIASPIGTAFEMAPPLIVTKEQLDRTVEVVAKSINDVARERRLA